MLNIQLLYDIYIYTYSIHFDLMTFHIYVYIYICVSLYINNPKLSYLGALPLTFTMFPGRTVRS